MVVQPVERLDCFLANERRFIMKQVEELLDEDGADPVDGAGGCKFQSRVLVGNGVEDLQKNSQRNRLGVVACGTQDLLVACPKSP